MTMQPVQTMQPYSLQPYPLQHGGPPAGQQGGHKLFVGMIPYSTGEADLQQLFSQFGMLMEVFMMREKDGRSKGCAFVRFFSKPAADAACATLNGSMSLPGATRALVVKYADPPSEPRMQRQAQQAQSGARAGGGYYVSNKHHMPQQLGSAAGNYQSASMSQASNRACMPL